MDVPPEVAAAYRAFNDAKTLHARLKRRERGAEDDVELWVERGVRSHYRDPYFELIDRGTVVDRYYPARRQLFQVKFDVPGTTTLDWLPPLLNVHFKFPSGAFGQYEAIEEGQFRQSPAWIAKGIKLPNEGLMDLYFAKTSGDLLGWIERYPDGFERSFDVVEWAWDDGSKFPAPKLPADAQAVDADVVMYLEPGRPFPPSALADAQGKETTIADLMPDAVGAIVTIGSPGCGPCVQMKRWLHDHRDELGSAGIVAVAIELMDEKDFVAEAARHQSPPLLLRAIEPSARTEMKVGGMPTNYLLDDHGRVIAGFQSFDPQRMATCIQEIVGK